MTEKMFLVNGQRMKTWNPLRGECGYHCGYCWARKLIEQKKMAKYRIQNPNPPFDENAFKKRFKPGEHIFVQDMTDLFAENVSMLIIAQILDYTRKFPETRFYWLTKNPKRYEMFSFDANHYLGITLETNRENNVYDAPNRESRFKAFQNIKHLHKFLSIEPIMDFDPEFLEWIRLLKPEFVYIGYDNYKSGLPEPSKSKFWQFVGDLQNFTQVRPKTMESKIGENKSEKAEDYFKLKPQKTLEDYFNAPKKKD
jgi:hypothetical protein